MQPLKKAIVKKDGGGHEMTNGRNFNNENSGELES